MASEVQGLDLRRWRRERVGGDLASAVRADVSLGRTYGLRPRRPYTPAFFIGATGSRGKPLLHFSLIEAGAFDEAVEALLST